MVHKQAQHAAAEKRRFHATSISPAVLARLRSIPWCTRLLENTSFEPIVAEAREPKASTEDSLLAETLRTSTTIHTWEYFYRQNPEAQHDPTAPWAELNLIVGCGEGLNGHPEILHGGMFSFILDEAMTMLACLHRPEGQSGMTASLTVDYKKPVPTPCTILAKCFLLPESRGRKVYLKGSLEDGEGAVFATAKILVIEVPANKIKL